MKKNLKFIFLTIIFFGIFGLAKSSLAALDVPTITATAKGPNQINLTWAAVTNPGWGYEVWIQSDNDSRYSSYTKLTWQNGATYLPYWVTESNYTDPSSYTGSGSLWGPACQLPVFGLKNNTTYSFKVRTYGKNDSGVDTYSSYSSVSSATTRNYTIKYVRTDGNDANTGNTDTSGGAWRHISYAATQAEAGTLVLVHGGTYASDHLVSAASGTTGVDTRIVFQAYYGEIPNITNQDTAIAIDIKHNYVIIDGLKISTTGNDNYNVMFDGASRSVMTNMEYDGNQISPQWGPGIAYSSTYNLIHNVYFHDVDIYTTESGSTLGIASTSHYNTIQFSHFTRGSHDTGVINLGCTYNRWLNNLHDGGWGIGLEDFGDYNFVEGSIMKDMSIAYGSGGDDNPGIELASTYSTYRRNIVKNGSWLSSSVTPHGFELSRAGHGVDHCLIYNNVIYHMEGAGVSITSAGPLTNNIIRNNIMYNIGGLDPAMLPNTIVFYGSSDYSGTVVSYNDILYTSGGIEYPNQGVILFVPDGSAHSVASANMQHPTYFSNNITVTPDFIDLSSEEFHIKSTSGLIDAGQVVSDSTWGTIGETDIGAFRYFSSQLSDTTPPAAPSGLSVS
jgi:hypothetical protein